MAYHKAVFLDRDGTLIEDKMFMYKPNELNFLEGVFEGLNLLKEKYLFFIITNQTGIGRGIYTVEDFYDYNNQMILDLMQHNINILRTCFCPHLKEDNCNCRKPKTQFIDEIVNEFDVDLKNSWTIGDHPCDVGLGINAGCKSIYLLTGHGKKHIDELKEKRIIPTYIASNFLGAAIIMNQY